MDNVRQERENLIKQLKSKDEAIFLAAELRKECLLKLKEQNGKMKEIEVALSKSEIK